METIVAIVGAIAALIAVPAAILAVVDYFQKRSSDRGSALLRQLARSQGSTGGSPLFSNSDVNDNGGLSEGQSARIARIMARARDSSDPLVIWQDYLRRTMLFPFEAIAEQATGTVEKSQTVLVRRLLGKTVNNDIVVQIVAAEEVTEAELSALQPTDRAATQYQLVSDYRAWREYRGQI